MARNGAPMGTRGAERPARRLEGRARQAVRHFVRILARSGYSPQAIESEVVSACRGAPKVRLSSIESRRMVEILHVISMWFSEPQYLDARGHPRPLPARGSPLSMESLLHRVNPKLDFHQAMRSFEQARVLKRIGARFVPRSQIFITPAPEYTSSVLWGLFGHLKTIEHNWGKRGTRARLEQFAWNPRFPVSGAAAFERRIRNIANRLLVRTDADMHRRELARRPGERTVQMGVGFYQFEGGPIPREYRVQRSGKSNTRRRPK